MRKPPRRFEDFEIHPIKRSPQGMLVTDDDSADFFTLYGLRQGELFAIGDYNTREEAEECQTSIRTV